MTDPNRIADELMADSFATPAAILVAFDDDPQLVILKGDVAHVATLRRVGCLVEGQLTRLGEEVADVLRNVHGVRAWKWEGS